MVEYYGNSMESFPSDAFCSAQVETTKAMLVLLATLAVGIPHTMSIAGCSKGTLVTREREGSACELAGCFDCSPEYRKFSV